MSSKQDKQKKQPPKKTAGKHAAVPDANSANSIQNSDYKVHPNYNSGFLATSKVTNLTKLIAEHERQTETLEAQISKKQKHEPNFLFLFIIKLIEPSKKPDNQFGAFRSNRFVKHPAAMASYKTCVLCADLRDISQHTCVILLKTNDHRNNFVSRDMSLQHLAVGVRIAVLSPWLDGNQFSNGAWVITTNRPVEVLVEPKLPIRPLQAEKVSDDLRYFVLKNRQVELLSADTINPLKTKCGFYTCNHQNSFAIQNGRCGCWQTDKQDDRGPRQTVLMLNFCFQDSNDKWQRVKNFTSLRTSKLFFEDQNILFKMTDLQNNDVYELMQDRVRNSIGYVNNNGGWKIVGWFVTARLETDGTDNNEDHLYRMTMKINVAFLMPTKKTTEIPNDHLLVHDEIRTRLAGNTKQAANDSDAVI